MILATFQIRVNLNMIEYKKIIKFSSKFNASTCPDEHTE